MRIRTKDVKRMKIRYWLETDDPEVDPVKAGLDVGFDDEVVVTKSLLLEMHETVAKTFKNLIENEVE
jgi:hypothetical protein